MENKLNFDQHFLKNTAFFEVIKQSAKLGVEDVVLEIGPGEGILTRELAKCVKNVIAVEVDERFKDALKKLPANVEILYNNILDILPSLTFNKIIANIPFSISEPLFKKLMRSKFSNAVLFTGKKFHTRLTTEKSKLATISGIFFDIKKIAEVPRSSFEPAPRVDVVLLLIERRKKELTKTERRIKEFLLRDDKKVKNAMIYALWRVDNKTKRRAREQIAKLPMMSETLEKNVDALSNAEGANIFKVLENIR
ncbi:MAG TPA: rRNA adenine N-6-methyltransferase family protein [Candidatus Nanoarchaeia archaeon]|nr:rRNA adenine N-6-methyltransferase family protein [Candidatus Nanoarchaeia archaeon]